jgi:hypothetical protein
MSDHQPEKDYFECHACDWTSTNAAEAWRHRYEPGHVTFRASPPVRSDTADRLLAEARAVGVRPHGYVGLGPMDHPDDVIDCCRFGPGHPVHDVSTPPAGGEDRG